MAPPRSDVITLLDAAEAHLRVGSVAETADALTRSHLPDLRCVGWYGVPPAGWTVAIDAEYAAADPPEPLVRRFGADDFWQRWTRAECLCKLADVPMLAWWPEHGLGVPAGFDGEWRTLRIPSPAGDLVVSLAAAAS